ncbi:ANTAR domain-containing protein [Nakamurella sp.]|uniref:GAF and ANTAR domain-containing protein n=1 Tax=Nakamurella sp. TaxID=1869182 RepID=UPI003782F399
MTDAVVPVDGAADPDGPPIEGVMRKLDGATSGNGLPAGTIAEAVRSAVTLPDEDGARLLMELTLAGGPWDSAAVACRLPSGTWGTRTGTGALGQVCDRLQWELGEGPARDALTTGLVSAHHLTADPRWPTWRTEVRALGARAAVSARLYAGRTLGTLTVYATHPVDPDRAAGDHLRTMAAHLSVLLDMVDRRRNLEQGMVNRGIVGQAIGLLVERYGIAADQAFATLRRISQSENQKMAHLATVLVQSGDLPGLHGRGD